MAVAFDARTISAGTAANFDHTPSGTPTLAVFTGHWDGAADATSDVTAVTYGGVSMTQKAFLDTGGATGGPTSKHVVEIWTLENPTAGLKTVSITRAGTAALGEVYVLTTFTGSLTSGATGTVDTDSEGSKIATATSGVTVSSETDGLVFDALIIDTAEALTPDGGQTERTDSGDGSFVQAGNSTEPGAASVAMGWSWTTASRYAYIAIPIRPSAAVLNKPTGLIATALGDSISLSWTDTNSGAYPARVYWKRTVDVGWNTDDLTEADTSYVLYWLVAETSYDVGVTYFNPAGTDESNMVTATTSSETVRLISGSFL